MVLVVAPVEALVEASVAGDPVEASAVEDPVVVVLVVAFPLAEPAEAFVVGVPSEESLEE